MLYGVLIRQRNSGKTKIDVNVHQSGSNPCISYQLSRIKVKIMVVVNAVECIATGAGACHVDTESTSSSVYRISRCTQFAWCACCPSACLSVRDIDDLW